jgi:hypothetical protein
MHPLCMAEVSQPFPVAVAREIWALCTYKAPHPWPVVHGAQLGLRQSL